MYGKAHLLGADTCCFDDRMVHLRLRDVDGYGRVS